MARMIKAKLSCGLVAAACLLVSGCSSVAGRGDGRFYPGVYPGLTYHAADYTGGSEGQEAVRSGYEDPVYDKKKVERRMAAIIDFPFTFVLDTALLPWDLLYWAVKGNSK